MGKPGIFYKQRDLSQSVQGYSGTVLGICGDAQWGPVDTLTLIDNLNVAYNLLGPPKSPTLTPLLYQLFGWFKKGKSCYVVRPQGSSKYGGIEALKGASVAAISSPLTDLPGAPSGANVIGIYTKYPGVHWNGDIYVWISGVDETVGEFTLECGTGLNEGGNALDVSHEDYEKHVVSNQPIAKDGFGRSAFIFDVLDRDSKLLSGAAMEDAAVDDLPINSVAVIALSQQAYAQATEGQIAIGYDLFKSVSAVTIDLIIPGLFSIVVVNKVIEVADTRGDCFAIVSPEVDATWTLDGISGIAGWISGITVRSYAAAGYAMYYKVKDEFNDKTVFVPAAGFIAGAYAYNDYVAAKWYAPAGAKRGVQNATIAKIWTSSDEDTLYDRSLNFVSNSPEYGTIIEGQKTLYGTSSALQRINVSRLILQIKRDLMSYLKSYLYEFNNDINRALIYSGVDDYLGRIKSGEGLYDYRVVCDTTNNPPSVIDNNQLVVDIYLKPVRVAEWIYLKSTIVATGVNFDDIVAVANI